MEVENVTANAIFERTFDCISADRLRFGIAFVALTMIGILADSTTETGWVLASSLGYFGASVIAQTKVTETVLLMREGALAGDVARNRYFGVFGALFASQLAILAGGLVLLIPGLYLYARWYVLIPALLDSRRAPQSAFAMSYRLTGRRVWPVTIVALVFGLAIIVFGFVPLTDQFQDMVGRIGLVVDTDSTVFKISWNALTSLVSLGSWYAAAAMYGLLNDNKDGLSEIFA